MTTLGNILAAALTLAAGAVQAEYATIRSEQDFRAIVSGKSLTRPMIRLEVTPSGAIRGTGAAWEVSGSWTWRDGYFCRDLTWGGDDLGYNCQEVRVDGARIRFTSDRGKGQSAEFRLRPQ